MIIFFCCCLRCVILEVFIVYHHSVNYLLRIYDPFEINIIGYLIGEFTFGELAPSEQSKTDQYAIDSDGNPYLPSWYTLNVRGQMDLLEALNLKLGLENITDQRYRTYSSGISSPGINFVASLQYDY